MNSNIGSLDQSLVEVQTAFHYAYSALGAPAMDLMYWLATTGMIITTLLSLLRGEGMSQSLSKLFMLGLFVGIAYSAMALAGSWISDIINGFMQAGGQAAGITGLDPSSIFINGISIATSLLKSLEALGWGHFATDILMVISALFIVLVYALIAADLAIVLVKAYALITVAPIVFALGTFELTRPTLNNYLKAIIGIGLNLMTIYIIVGAGVAMSAAWYTDITSVAHTSLLNFAPVLTVMGGAIMLYLIQKNIPPFIAGLSGIGGFRNYGDAAVAGMMTAASVGAGAVTAPFKVAGAVKNAAGAIGSGAVAAAATAGVAGTGAMMAGRGGLAAAKGAMAAGHHIASAMKGQETAGAFQNRMLKDRDRWMKVQQKGKK